MLGNLPSLAFVLTFQAIIFSANGSTTRCIEKETISIIYDQFESLLTPTLLNVLQEKNLIGTFFVDPNSLKEEGTEWFLPSIVQHHDIVIGISLGSAEILEAMTDEGLVGHISNGLDLIEKATGVRSRLATVKGSANRKLLNKIADCGLTVIFPSIDMRGAINGQCVLSAEAMNAGLIDHGLVVAFSSNAKSCNVTEIRETAEALKGHGYRVEALSKCIGISSPYTPTTTGLPSIVEYESPQTVHTSTSESVIAKSNTGRLTASFNLPVALMIAVLTVVLCVA